MSDAKRYMCVSVLENGDHKRPTHFLVVDANDFNEKIADLQTALNLTESLYTASNKIVGELELELSELKASADKEITHWQSAAVEVQQDNERLELREADNLNLIISQRREVEDLRLQLAAVTKERDELKSGKYDIGSMLSSDDYPPNEAALIKDNGDAP